MTYEKYLNKKETPQNLSFRNDQICNSAGGYVFKVDPLMQLKRFLALGTTGGSYYIKEADLTQQNLDNIKQLLDEDYKTVLDLTAEMSRSGRIIKNDPAIVVLCLAFCHPRREVRKYASEKFHEIIRIPTHLFTFMRYLKGMRGFGRLIRRTINDWYLDKSEDELVYHILKYQQRQGWKHLDVLRLVHPKPANEFQDKLFGWLAGKKEPPQHDLIDAFIKLRRATSEQEVVKIIENSNVTWEFVPTCWLSSVNVWRALLPKLPFTALVRNLARMSAIGLLQPFSDETKFVVEKITNRDTVRQSKIHPIQAAVAAKTYASGRGFRGKLRWQVNTQITEALNELVVLSFDNVEPTGKRFLLGLDVSGSMSYFSACDVLTCMEASAIMALATVKAEDQVQTMAFAEKFQEFPIYKNDSVDSIIRRMEDLEFGATDCSLPMLYALEHKIPVDIFVIYTDDETWWGDIHPCQALEKYRRKVGIPAKLAVVGMVANKFSIADPNDPFQLDFVGFDPTTPRAISEFAKLE